MSAGMPGLGLGGMFFVLSALLAPVPELIRTVRGGSSRDTWRRVGRQFAIAVSILVAIDLTLRAVLVIGWLAGLSGHAPTGITAMPLLPIGITAALLAAVLLAAKGAQLWMRLLQPRRDVRWRLRRREATN